MASWYPGKSAEKCKTGGNSSFNAASGSHHRPLIDLKAWRSEVERVTRVAGPESNFFTSGSAPRVAHSSFAFEVVEAEQAEATASSGRVSGS